MEVTPIPNAKTHVDGLNADERFEAYRTAAQPLADTEPIRGQATEDALYSGWIVDDLLAGHAAFTPTLFRRTAAQARQDGAFLLQTYSDGEQHGEVDGQPLHHTADRIVLQDTARPYVALARARKCSGIYIPRHRIEARDQLYRHHPVVAFGLATPQGRILHHAMNSFLDLLPDLSRTDAPAIASGFVGLLNGLLTSEDVARVEDPHVNAACLEAMKAFLGLRGPLPFLAALQALLQCPAVRRPRCC